MSTNVQGMSEAAVYRWNLEERRYEYVSPGIAGITGFLAEELDRMGREQWVARIHPEDRARVATEMKAVLGGGRATVFYRFLRKDGTYRLLMEHLYVAMGGERRAFLDGMLRDVTDQLSAAAWPAAAEFQGGGVGTGEAIVVPVRSSVKGKVAVGAGIAALLIITLGTGYVAGLRHAAWSRAGTASSARTPGSAQVASRASNPGGTDASHHGTKATERARIIEARAASPQRPRRTLRNRVAAAPSARPVVAASQAARPSFWSWVAHVPQPIAPDPPSFH